MTTRVDQARAIPIFASQTVALSTTITSAELDFGNARWIEICVLATFNAAATNGATINLLPTAPVPTTDTRSVATYSAATYSIPYVSGAQVHIVRIEVPSQRCKITLVNDDTGQSITAVSASFVRVND